MTQVDGLDSVEVYGFFIAVLLLIFFISIVQTALKIVGLKNKVQRMFVTGALGLISTLILHHYDFFDILGYDVGADNIDIYHVINWIALTFFLSKALDLFVWDKLRKRKREVSTLLIYCIKFLIYFITLILILKFIF